MGGIFSKKKKKQTRITEVDNQVLTLKMQRDQIVIFRRKLDVQYKAAADAAKCLLREDKKTLAFLALKRRKHQAELIDQAENHLLQVNTLISNVEMASMQADIVKALESGNQALKKIQAEVSVDYVSKLMDENAELQSEVTEIGQMLSSVQTEDPELFDEYQKLEAQVALDKISEVPNVPNSSLPEGMTQQATEGDTMTNRQEVFTESSESIEESVAVAAE